MRLVMRDAVLCECGAIYDRSRVTVTARYADCSVWRTPCCGREEDDRPWTRHYRELEAVAMPGQIYVKLGREEKPVGTIVDARAIMHQASFLRGPDGVLYRVKGQH